MSSHRDWSIFDAKWGKITTLAASTEIKRANRDFRASALTTKEEVRADSGLGLPPETDGETNPVMGEVIASDLPWNRTPAMLVDEIRAILAYLVLIWNGRMRIPRALPFRLLTLVRSVAFPPILAEEAKGGTRWPECHYPVAYPPEDEHRAQFVAEPLSAERMPRARELVIETAGMLGDRVMQSVLPEILQAYLGTVGATISKIIERRRACWFNRPAREP
ncbi:unnamed protein product [Phytophthora fragariaefolia]|uniref:Unnamed protein product n=1 Tax=Phytophthora fragariaefolia TaxID=1490495 RepID=A0A9W6TUZ4_9STRA|nr:unnamed protein product [Phytophthora fragariaefolia]